MPPRHTKLKYVFDEIYIVMDISYLYIVIHIIVNIYIHCNSHNFVYVICIITFSPLSSVMSRCTVYYNPVHGYSKVRLSATHSLILPLCSRAKRPSYPQPKT